MDDTLSINSNRTLNPWEAKEALTHSSVNEMYDDTIDAGAKGKHLNNKKRRPTSTR